MRSMRPPLAARRAAAVLVVGLLVTVGSESPATATVTQYSTGTPFTAGVIWHGQFADPAIIKVGDTYWAYATVTGGDNLPAMHSTDLKTWHTRAAYPAGANPGWWPGYNDALPHPAKWAYYGIERNGRWFTNPWAPSVARVGTHYVLAYSVPVNRAGRRCISIATSSSPQGQFLDRSTHSFVCSSDPGGSIDPQVFTTSTGAYLMWKNAGVPGSSPTRIWARKLSSSGTSFAANSSAKLLLSTAQAWEGNVIENPAMIRYAGRYYLFYSANRYSTAQYAIGYAICSSPLGSCHRPQRVPLLATGGTVAGPGGPAPIVGPAGALRLGYAAWDAGHVGPGSTANIRRLHVARLEVGAHGILSVVARG